MNPPTCDYCSRPLSCDRNGRCRNCGAQMGTGAGRKPAVIEVGGVSATDYEKARSAYARFVASTGGMFATRSTAMMQARQGIYRDMLRCLRDQRIHE
jgi:hypothetical protein